MGYFISDDEIYVEYLKWADVNKMKTISKSEFIRKSPKWIEKYRIDLQRNMTRGNSVYEMRAVVLEERTGKIITPNGLKLMTEWLSETKETLICIPMICEKVFGMSSKGSRKLSNEICFAMRNLIFGWKEIGVARTENYGNQLCFVRKNN